MHIFLFIREPQDISQKHGQWSGPVYVMSGTKLFLLNISEKTCHDLGHEPWHIRGITENILCLCNPFCVSVTNHTLPSNLFQSFLKSLLSQMLCDNYFLFKALILGSDKQTSLNFMLSQYYHKNRRNGFIIESNKLNYS